MDASGKIPNLRWPCQSTSFFLSTLFYFFALLSVFPLNAPFYLRSNPSSTSTMVEAPGTLGDVTKISSPYLWNHRGIKSLSTSVDTRAHKTYSSFLTSSSSILSALYAKSECTSLEFLSLLQLVHSLSFGLLHTSFASIPKSNLLVSVEVTDWIETICFFLVLPLTFSIIEI